MVGYWELMFDLTNPRIKPQTSCFRDERVERSSVKSTVCGRQVGGQLAGLVEDRQT